MSESRELGVAGSANYLGVAPRTIRRYIASGRLPALRVGPRIVRIRVEDLNALIRPIVGGESQ